MPRLFKNIVRGQNRLEVRSEGSRTELHLIGSIGKSWWDDSGISEQEVRDALKSIPKGQKIDAYINSDGGSTKDGMGIYDAFKARAADITCRVCYALSIASVIPLGAGKVISPSNATWMIHQCWGTTSGNADDKRKDAEMMDTIDASMAKIISKKTGKSESDVLDDMKAETWMTADEAVEYGLADETGEENETDLEMAAAYVPRIFDRCKHLPAVMAAAINVPNRTIPAINAAPNPTDTMNKKLVIALLKKHGIEAVETETDEQLQAKLDKIPIVPPIAAPAPIAANIVDIAALQASLTAEKKARITAEVTRRSEGKIENDKLAWWITLAMTDEAGTFAQLDSLPVAQPGGPTLEFNRIANSSEAPWDRIRKENKTHQARYKAMIAEWPGLINDAFARDSRRGGSVVAANSYSATLITNFLIDSAVTQLQPRFAALKCFAKDYSTDAYKPRATGQLKFNQTTTDGSQVQKNATNFESGDATINPVSISVDQYTSAFHVTNDELNSGLRMENLMEQKLADLAYKITGVATAPITAANFNVLTPIVSPAATFGFGVLQGGWGQLKKSIIHNAILDGEYLARIINVPTQFQKTGVEPGTEWAGFGWDNVALNTDWASAGANVRGFLCNPQAVGAISGLPLTPPNIPGATLQQATMTLPEVGISIAIYYWFSLSTRTLWCSYDMMFGASLLDPSAGILITSS